MQILGEAEDCLPVIEANRGERLADGEDVSLLTGAAEPSEEGAITTTDGDVRHVTGGPLW